MLSWGGKGSGATGHRLNLAYFDDDEDAYLEPKPIRDLVGEEICQVTAAIALEYKAFNQWNSDGIAGTLYPEVVTRVPTRPHAQKEAAPKKQKVVKTSQHPPPPSLSAKCQQTTYVARKYLYFK